MIRGVPFRLLFLMVFIFQNAFHAAFATEANNSMAKKAGVRTIIVDAGIITEALQSSE